MATPLCAGATPVGFLVSCGLPLDIHCFKLLHLPFSTPELHQTTASILRHHPSYLQHHAIERPCLFATLPLSVWSSLSRSNISRIVLVNHYGESASCNVLWASKRRFDCLDSPVYRSGNVYARSLDLDLSVEMFLIAFDGNHIIITTLHN